jgi:hypothetical protein
VDEVQRNRERILGLLQQNMQQAQQRMKRYADLNITERTFTVGQSVYLRLQPYRQMSGAYRQSLKLSPRFYGPFTILRRVGDVAYELDLPPEARFHPVFHISQLKPKLGSACSALQRLPPIDDQGAIRPEPAQILDRRSGPKNNQALTEILVRWEGQTANDATCEEFHALKDAYPHLVGKVL